MIAIPARANRPGTDSVGRKVCAPMGKHHLDAAVFSVFVTWAAFLAAGDLVVGLVGAIDELDFKKFGTGNFCIMLLNIEPCELLIGIVLIGAASLAPDVLKGTNVSCFPDTAFPLDEIVWQKPFSARPKVTRTAKIGRNRRTESLPLFAQQSV